MRAQISSSCRRGAVAPVISVSPALTMSAARDSAPGPKRRLLHAHALELVLGDAAQHLRGALRHGRDDDEVAQPLEEVLDEPARVVTGLDDPVDLAERRRAVAGGERVDGRVEQLAVGEAEQRRPRRRRSAPRAPEPAMSWSSTDSESRTEPPPARVTKDSTPGATATSSASSSRSM